MQTSINIPSIIFLFLFTNINSTSKLMKESSSTVITKLKLCKLINESTLVTKLKQKKPQFTGAFGKVWVFNGPAGAIAFKSNEPRDENGENLVKNEIVAMNAFQNYYDLVSLKKGGCMFQDIQNSEFHDYYFQMDFYDKGELFNFMKKDEFKNTNLLYKFDLIYKITVAIKEMHDLDYKHLDLKLENVFLLNGYVPVIGDFGLTLQGKKQHKYFSGTPPYQSPEIFNSNYSTKYGDIYALGVMFWEIINRKGGSEKIIKNIPFDENPKSPEYSIFYSLIESMLRTKIKDRSGTGEDRIDINQVQRQLLKLIPLIIDSLQKNNLVKKKYDYFIQKYYENEKNFYNKSPNKVLKDIIEKTDFLQRLENRRTLYLTMVEGLSPSKETDITVNPNTQLDYNEIMERLKNNIKYKLTEIEKEKINENLKKVLANGILNTIMKKNIKRDDSNLEKRENFNSSIINLSVQHLTKPNFISDNFDFSKMKRRSTELVIGLRRRSEMLSNPSNIDTISKRSNTEINYILI